MLSVFKVGGSAYVQAQSFHRSPANMLYDILLCVQDCGDIMQLFRTYPNLLYPYAKYMATFKYVTISIRAACGGSRFTFAGNTYTASQLANKLSRSSQYFSRGMTLELEGFVFKDESHASHLFRFFANYNCWSMLSELKLIGGSQHTFLLTWLIDLPIVGPEDDKKKAESDVEKDAKHVNIEIGAITLVHVHFTSSAYTSLFWALMPDVGGLRALKIVCRNDDMANWLTESMASRRPQLAITQLELHCMPIKADTLRACLTPPGPFTLVMYGCHNFYLRDFVIGNQYSRLLSKVVCQVGQHETIKPHLAGICSQLSLLDLCDTPLNDCEIAYMASAHITFRDSQFEDLCREAERELKEQQPMRVLPDGTFEAHKEVVALAGSRMPSTVVIKCRSRAPDELHEFLKWSHVSKAYYMSAVSGGSLNLYFRSKPDKVIIRVTAYNQL